MKRISRRELLRGAAMGAAAAILAACAPAPTPTKAPEPTQAKAEPTKAPEATKAPEPTKVPATPAPKQPTTINVWGWCCYHWKRVPEDPASYGEEWFTEDTKGAIKVEITYSGYPDFQTALKTAMPAGSGPDVFMVNWQIIQPYASSEFVLPLEEMANQAWGDWKKQFKPGAVDEIERLGRLDGSGHAYFMPIYDQCLGMIWYSMPLFQKAGITEKPKHWAEFEVACEKLKAAGIAPLTMGGKDMWQHLDWFMSLAEVAAPGKLDQFQDGKLKLTDPDFVRIGQIYRDMYKKQWFPEGTIGTDIMGAIALFQQEKAAMILLGTHATWLGNPANMTDEQKQAKKHETWGCFLLPDSKGLVAIAMGNAITKASKNKEAAWEFVKWWSAGRGQDIQALVPEYPSHVGKEPKPVGNAFDQNVMQVMIKQLNEGPNTLRWLRCANLADQIGPEMQGIAMGKVTPEQSMANLQNVFDKLCKK